MSIEKRKMKQPVFLVGAERSGSTLLRLMLNGHPRINWLSEFEYSVDYISSDSSWPDATSYRDWLLTNRVFLLANLTIPDGMEYPQIIDSFLLQAYTEETIVVGATCHRHYDRLLRLYPNAKFIYLYRDPRDVARSNIGMGWAGNVWYGVDLWIEAETLWDEVKSHLSQEQFIEIKYEDVVTEPEKCLGRMCEFMGLMYDDQMLAYPNYTTYSYPDHKLIYQWKKKLTDKQITLVECKAAELMMKRHYEVAGDLDTCPTLFGKISLCVQNKLTKIAFRIKRYGVLLVFLDTASRRLNMKKLQKSTRMKMNRIANTVIK